jgi:hypothetical protein
VPVFILKTPPTDSEFDTVSPVRWETLTTLLAIAVEPTCNAPVVVVAEVRVEEAIVE